VGDTTAVLDLQQPHRIHVVGVGGSGMSAIASVLAAMGHQVSGSDLKDSGGLERLQHAGVQTFVGHAAEQIGDAEVVAVSTAVPPSNPEVVEAERRGIPVLRRAEVLAAICATRRTIAVGGTHGKTTTASMLALVLIEAGLRPSFIIGGDVTQIGSGAAWDEGEWFVVEADESDGTFVELPREIAVVTNVEPDHLEHYGGFAPLEEAFGRFVTGAEHAVVCADDPGAAALAAAHGGVTYGTDERAEVHMADLRSHGAGASFTLTRRSDGGRTELGAVALPVPGAHNARNAAAAFTAGLLAGASPEAGIAALERFAGVARRFESRGERRGITFVDDYAHLPTEVAAAIAAARSGPWTRVVCAFQPHRYSRTAALWPDFADAFEGVDALALTDIYSAGEQPRPGVTGKLLVDAVLDHHPWHRVAYLPRRADLVQWLVAELRPGDLCLSLGAGDITAVATEVLAVLDLADPPAPVGGSTALQGAGPGA
jgi:UDP-N-acetylmuramate--alanine ligase